MSGQTSQKLRRMASPSTTKQGPMKATQSFGLMQGSPTASRSSNGRKSSPSSSPTHAWSTGKSRRSPDHRSSPERGSPSSPQHGKEKGGKGNLRGGLSPVSHGIKRTSSLDSITAPYLKGEWPRETTSLQLCCGTCDKGTQTPEEWDEFTDKRRRASHKMSSAVSNGDTLREVNMIKASLIKNRKEGSRGMSSGIPRTSPVQGKHNALSATSGVQTKAITIPLQQAPVKLNPRMRGSVEGLNQEIERLTFITICPGIESDETTKIQCLVPDGHRAPVGELMGSTCSVDTQTPSGFCEDSKAADGSSSSSSSRSQSESPSIAIIPCLGKDNNENEEKEQESPEPNPKSFSKFVREPPDGCDKVILKVEEGSREVPPLKGTLFCPIVKPSGFHIPSQQSAFSKCPLLKPYVNQPSEMALKASKSSQDQSVVAAT